MRDGGVIDTYNHDRHMQKKYLVTGGAGFIGSHIAEALVQQGASVAVIDDLSTGTRENIEHLLDSVTFFEGSILDQELLRKAMEGVDTVFHQAALPSVPKSIKDPLGTHAVNVTGTLQIFETARALGVRRVVYASSSSVYGDSPVLPKVETMGYNPLSPYAVQKMTGEYYGRLYHQSFGLETVGLRYFNVFGPRQNPHSEYAAVIPKFITKIKAGEGVTIYGTGETTRDFTYIENVVHANLRAAEAEGVSGEVFNIALGESISLNGLVEKIAGLCGTTCVPQHEAFREGDIRHSLADITKAKTLLRYEPQVFFDEGLRRTIETL